MAYDNKKPGAELQRILAFTAVSPDEWFEVSRTFSGCAGIGREIKCAVFPGPPYGPRQVHSLFTYDESLGCVGELREGEIT